MKIEDKIIYYAPYIPIVGIPITWVTKNNIVKEGGFTVHFVLTASIQAFSVAYLISKFA